MAPGSRCDHCARPVTAGEIFCSHCGGVLAENLDAAEGAGATGFFLVQFPDGIFRKEVVRGERVRVGRGRECEIRIEHPRVSRLHALLELRAGVYHVSDARSSGGTFLNDHPVHGSVPLKSGDSIRLGRLASDAVTLVYHEEP